MSQVVKDSFLDLERHRQLLEIDAGDCPVPLEVEKAVLHYL